MVRERRTRRVCSDDPEVVDDGVRVHDLHDAMVRAATVHMRDGTRWRVRRLIGLGDRWCADLVEVTDDDGSEP